MTRKELIKALEIPESSLKDLLRLIKEDDYVTMKTKSGRNGYTRLWTVKSIVLSLLNERKNAYLKDKEALISKIPMIQDVLGKATDQVVNKEKLEALILKEIVNTS